MSDDTIINVTAYRTDEIVGFDHWRALETNDAIQPPVSDVRHRALLVLCADERQRAALREVIVEALKPETVDAAEAAQAARVERAIRLMQFRSMLEDVLLAALTRLELPNEDRFVIGVLAKAVNDLKNVDRAP